MGRETELPRPQAEAILREHLPEVDAGLLLRLAAGASLLEVGENLRFTHQLLQEYFAARRLDRELRAGTPASRFWPPQAWWQPQGWEETAILLAGLYSDDTTPVIEWLRDAQPELTARCVLESGAHTPPESIEALRARWIPRLTNLQTDPQPEARAAVGRALALLRLDNRNGVGVILLPSPGAEGAVGRGAGGEGILLPDIAWVEIPAGVFQMGGDPDAWDARKGGRFDIPYTFWMAKYPVTYAQYEAFVADDGYQNQDYWTKAGWQWRGKKTQPEAYWNDPQWHIGNHPVVGVTWYEAYAYTRWLDAKYREAGGVERFLPSPQTPLPTAPSALGEGLRGLPLTGEYRAKASEVLVQIARELRQRETAAEDLLWECLRNRRLANLKFRRQHPVANTPYVVDFFCYDHRLVIELDGAQHAARGRCSTPGRTGSPGLAGAAFPK
ncbi:MAG: hypothetical protein BroJett038_31300 [Chloroflexota bacterium]|nr:MAG: hypothetical protein BroJett038_31300 [Chloroflexota bacterium]